MAKNQDELSNIQKQLWEDLRLANWIEQALKPEAEEAEIPKETLTRWYLEFMRDPSCEQMPWAYGILTVSRRCLGTVGRIVNLIKDELTDQDLPEDETPLLGCLLEACGRKPEPEVPYWHQLRMALEISPMPERLERLIPELGILSAIVDLSWVPVELVTKKDEAELKLACARHPVRYNKGGALWRSPSAEVWGPRSLDIREVGVEYRGEPVNISSECLSEGRTVYSLNLVDVTLPEEVDLKVERQGPDLLVRLEPSKREG